MAVEINDREGAKKIIYDIIIKKIDIDESKLQEDANFVDDLGLDSLDVVELIMALEDEFGIEIPDDDMKKIVFIKDALDYIVEKLGIQS